MVTPLPNFQSTLSPRMPMAKPHAMSAATMPAWESLLGNVGSWVGDRQNRLMALGGQLISGDFDPYVMTQAAAMDRSMIRERGQRNSTMEAFEKAGRQDLIDYVGGGGSMGDAWNIYMRDMAAEKTRSQDLGIRERNAGFITEPQIRQAYLDGQVSLEEAMSWQSTGTMDPTSSMRDFQMAQANPAYADFINPTTAPAAPSGYRWSADGNLEAIPGGPAIHQSKPTEGQVRASSLLKQVEPDVRLLLGDDQGNPGTFDALGNGGDQFWNGINVFGAKPFTGLISSDYKEAQNAATNLAQTYLYLASGAAAPAEEVQKIAGLITPAPFDPPEVKKQKKARVAQYLEAIRTAAQREAAGGAQMGGGDGWSVVGVRN